MAVSPDGATIYMAAFGSGEIAVLKTPPTLKNNTFKR